MSVNEILKKDSADRLARMVTLLGFRAEVSAEESEDTLVLSLKTEEAGRLIGRKGHCLQALELLLDRMLRKQHGEGPAVEISIDGYRNPREHSPGERRGNRGGNVDEEQLRNVAMDTAKEVKRWGEPLQIGPFNAAERRVIHMALREDPAVVSASEEPDQTGRKRIIVRLAKRQDG